MKRAFSMVELIFVIVIIGILSGIAIPKFAATRDDAVISKGRATVGALRSAISMERQKRILKGVFTDVDASTAVGLLDYGLDSKWTVNNGAGTFTFAGPSGNTVFTLSANKLDCTSGCSNLGF